MKTILSTLTLFFIGVTLTGQSQTGSGIVFNTQLNTITTAVPFMLIARDARSSGIGDAGVATTPDANSIYWNTSKLAFSEYRSEMTLNYTPLFTFIDDVHLSNASGYVKLGERHTVTGSATYFNLGEITFTDEQGNLIRQFSPTEYSITAGYALKLGDRHAIGLNGKFIYSDLTGGINAGTVGTRAGLAGAGDISYSYLNQDVKLGKMESALSLALNISNLGNKMSYTTEADRDFLPANLRLGSAFSVDLNENHSVSTAVDFNKLLVPTSPFLNGSGVILSGMPNDVGTIQGIIQSFYDAPGNVIVSPSGTVSIEKNSRLKEELN